MVDAKPDRAFYARYGFVGVEAVEGQSDARQRTERAAGPNESAERRPGDRRTFGTAGNARSP
jgi:hypothetical protein